MSAEDLSSSDHALTRKIQPIDMVKHNPNIFWYNPKSVTPFVETLGGTRFVVSTFVGAMASVSYFNQ